MSFSGQNSVYYSNFVYDHQSAWLFKTNDERNKRKVLNLIPIDQFVKDFILVKQADCDVSQEDYVLIRVLEYFRNELFKWFDKYKCDRCETICDTMKRVSPTNEESKWICSLVELYQCASCGKFYRFPRYNHPEKLLETRTGRCGEWAIAFTFICISLGYDSRLVYCTTDHVWCEVWNNKQNRWVHVDPCENVYDNPFMYQCGWNKTIDLVVAYGKHEVRDVTWRYTTKWKQTLEDRKRKFNQSTIDSRIESLNNQLQSSLTIDERLKLNQKWLIELIEFIRTPDQDDIQIDDKALQGRQSGSLQWRLGRAEINVNKAYTFSIGDNCAKAIMSFDCKQNEYHLLTSDSSNLTINSIFVNNWSDGCFFMKSISRKIEHDWNQCYLARSEHSSSNEIGKICWRFELKDSNWKNIEITVNGALYESASAKLVCDFQTKKFPFELNEKFVLNREQVSDSGHDCSSFQIEASLVGGNGSCAWQHAQLFRQSTIIPSKCPFIVQILY